MVIEGIILRHGPYRERDQFVVLYTAQLGKLAAIAKGSLSPRSHQAAFLDVGNRIECRLVEASGLPIITGARSIHCYSHAKSSPVRWAAMQFFLQACDAIVYDRQPDDALWHAVTSALTSLTGEGDPIVLLRQHQIALLDVMGYGRMDMPPATAARTLLDDEFERIAQRRLGSIDLVYALARGSL